MKFENIQEAKKEFIKIIMLTYDATLKGDDKLQEKYIKKAFVINKYIKNNFDLREMKDLLDYDSPQVQIWIANMLLPVYEEVSLEILKKIAEQKIPFTSYNAEMMIYSWERKKFDNI